MAAGRGSSGGSPPSTALRSSPSPPCARPNTPNAITINHHRVRGCGYRAQIVAMKETLKPSERKPFSLRRANPIASISLLFRLDPGLRSLAISAFLKDLSASMAAILNMFRMASRTVVARGA